MAICEICKKRNICREICPQLKKEISARGISPRMKDKTYTVNFNLLENNQSLNDFQLEVRRKTIQNTSLKEIARIDLQDLIRKHLAKKERQAVQFFLKGYRQQEIAGKMKISRMWVNILLKRAMRKLKDSFH
jgi:RNA polymerase sigma factor (sigma-70 family)